MPQVGDAGTSDDRHVVDILESAAGTARDLVRLQG